MSEVNYLNGYMYHMVHFDNLRSIFQRRAILSKQKVLQERIRYHSIANDEVQGFRDRIYIWDFSRQKFRSLHSYVPFYFATRPPMLHNKYTEGVQDSIVIFEVSRTILKDPGVLFTNGNASISNFPNLGVKKWVLFLQLWEKSVIADIIRAGHMEQMRVVLNFTVM